MKQRIAAAYMQLARSGDVDRITVTSLVEACGISRQTFYYHFRDIMDVLEWGIRQTLERDLEASLQTPDSRAAIQIFVTRAVQKRTALRLLLDSHRRPELERLLIRALRTYLRELFRRRYPRSALSAADLAAALDFYACGIIGVLLGSCRQPNPDPEALTDQICRLLSGEMLRQLS